MTKPLLPFFCCTTSLLLGALQPAGAQTETPAVPDAPKLQFHNRLIQGTLGEAYQRALDNLLRINTVPDTKGEHNKAGLMTTPPGTFFKAGGGYGEPWTRDASINSWNAGSLLSPVVARNTLWAVCQKQPDGSVVLQRDNQWWDKVIWITAAWNHYKVTGDTQFLTTAYGVAQDELALMRQEHFNATYGLFKGPSFFNDGIAGYPAPLYDSTNNSSFVLDHHYTSDIMSLSTNCVYYNAYRCAAQMAQQLARPTSEIQNFNKSAEELKTAINKQLWNGPKGTYAYFIHGTGPLAGKRDESQEGIGLSYAILFGVADAKQAASILKNAYISPHGIMDSWPPFERFSEEKPGRHNNIVWPLINGMWATAAAQGGDIAKFQDETENLALLSDGPERGFFEIYNGTSGKPDGGWQGGHWGPLSNQTWSATAYLRMMYGGLFGMNFQPDGLKFAPKLPAGWGNVQLQGVKYRGTALDINLNGAGEKVSKVMLDGKTTKTPFIPATWTGKHVLEITLK